MNQHIEIELTFLAAYMPNEIAGVTPTEIEDIYVTAGTGTSIIRLRKQDNDYELTKKGIIDTGDFSKHTEETIHLTKQEYYTLGIGSQLKIIKKRYKTQINGFDAEVDVFAGRLDGLVTIDFEFDDIEVKDIFIKPDCCLVDVTQEKEISAGCLVSTSYDDMTPWLRTKGYEKIV
jgi:CYTH domain-containing protein